MKTNCFQLTDELQLIPIEYESAVDVVRKPDECTWIDLQGFNNSELEKVLNDLEVKEPARRLCLDTRDHSCFFPTKTGAFLVIPLQVAEEHHVMKHCAFLCRPGLLLTFREHQSLPSEYSVNREESAAWLADKSVAGLLSSIMMGLSVEALRKTSELRYTIITLEDRMDREPTSVNAREISSKRSELLTLESVVSGQLPIIEALLSTDRPSINLENTQEYLIWASANLQSADRLMQWLEKRIDVLRYLADQHANDETNRRLGRLTVLSMIFMPMTLLAGIWGMNFQMMPELTKSYGYPMALGLMLLVGAGVYFYFRRRGWFD